ncbi:RNA-binding domain-containing protein [Sarocladium strictum]
MAKKKTSLVPAKAAIDPTLDALFSSSAGPLKVPSKTRYSAPLEKKPPTPVVDQSEDDDEEEGNDEELSEISEEFDDGGSDVEEDEAEEDDGDSQSSEDEAEDDQEDEEEADDDVEMSEPAAPAVKAIEALETTTRERKRKRKDDHDDLEAKYMTKLIQEEEPEGKRRRASGSPEAKTSKAEDDDDVIPVHESISKDDQTSEIEKAARTVFLANVSSSAITSKSAKKTLLAHLASIFPDDDPSAPKVESLRFRSTAFSEMSMPKRAAYITGALLSATTQSTNAYAVYTTPAAARKAAAELNGTVVLDRHIRVDSVAHPTPTAHRRCVFVGNLGFVDDETVVRKDENGETTEKKRHKVPADVEEGLWRTFGAQGKVENVRVVRDPKTRVGKGFAYVQFYDTNAVESALLLDGKKFPPMLPRPLRVTRAKDPRKTALAQERSLAKTIAQGTKNTKYKYKATPEEQSMAGRTGKLLGRAAVFQQKKGGKKGPRDFGSTDAAPSMKTPEQIVFEGRRVSNRDTMPTDLKGKKKGKGKKPPGKPQHRGARRGAEWKAKNKV